MRVAINGIGIAGPTLAYWLRAFGHEPVLFEKSPTLRTGGYLIDFWGLGYEVAERMGLIPALLDCGYIMERLRFVDERGRQTAMMDVSPIREALGDRFTSLARSDLAAVLFGACDGVQACFGQWVTSVDDTGRAAVATLSDGRRESFDLVIGCDGLHSQVRASVFGPAEQFETFLDCYVGAFRVAGYPRRDELTYVSHTAQKRHAARVSLRHDETLILLICRAELIDGDPARGEEKQALRRAFAGMGWEVPEILDWMDAAADVYFDRISQIHLPRWTSGRVALLGDAAACPSLLAGDGTGLAMAEAYVLAGELHRAGGDVARAFAAYHDRLHSFVTAKQKGAIGFRGFFVPESGLGLKVRNAAVHLFSPPFLLKRFVAHSLHDDLELPNYLSA